MSSTVVWQQELLFVCFELLLALVTLLSCLLTEAGVLFKLSEHIRQWGLFKHWLFGIQQRTSC